MGALNQQLGLRDDRGAVRVLTMTPSVVLRASELTAGITQYPLSWPNVPSGSDRWLSQ
jgi:hypothetical protein